jgi:hypothetical protein
MRAAMSVLPPGGKATINFNGISPARAKAANASASMIEIAPAADAKRSSWRRLACRVIVVLLLSKI